MSKERVADMRAMPRLVKGVAHAILRASTGSLPMSEKQTDVAEVNRLLREVMKILPIDIDLMGPVVTSLMASYAATVTNDHDKRLIILDVLRHDEEVVMMGPSARL
jgi:hypothetical protein